MAPKKRKASGAAAKVKQEPSSALENLSFLESDADGHVVASLYRVASSDPCRARRPVQDEGSAVVAGNFPNPFLAIDFNDKQGVWQKEIALTKALGEDPGVNCRHRIGDRWRPAGLRNLGATCYLNSLLQYLFFNLDFRYSLLRTQSESQVVAALQQVFALLAEGESLVVDPKDFITAARVDALEQADATEFSALLLDWLQRELSSGGDFIPALFEGQTSTVVQCSQDKSHSSEKRECFMELRAALSPVAVALEAKEAKEASASGRKSGPKSKAGKKASKKPLPTIRLEQILQAAAFPEEILDGSNQWVCPQCDRKVDARKTTRLSKLPPYLHVTVERYHFDSESHERKRLAHPVSFPRRLELCHLVEAQGAGESATLPVAYECIGFLEHVSDSAHSGHYRATLLREEEEPHVASKGGDEVCEPSPKRPKIDDGDAAAGAPQRGSWWRLDDETVTAADGESKAEGSEATVSPLCERIESSTAYLVLYRRCDHDPGQLSCGRRSGRVRCAPPLAPELLRAVDEHNTELRRQRKEFESNSLAVERFTAERRRAVTCLAQALQQEADRADGKADLTFVPTRWLEKFLRGEDRTLQNILEGDASIVPPIYSQALIKGRNCPVAIDPLAIWCGEVKLLPTAALAQVGGAFGGLDSSTLLQNEEAMNDEVGQLVFKAFQEFRKECDLKAKIQASRMSVTDVRGMETAGQDPNFAAWISLRQLNQWKKVLGEAVPPVPRQRVWQHFVQQVRECRFGGTASPDGAEAADAEASDEEVAQTPQPVLEVPADVKEATMPIVPEVTLLGGLFCPHGLLCRPRAAALVPRASLEELLQVAKEKDRAFRELWPETAACMRPCLRSGLPGNKLLCFAEVCAECRSVPGEEVKRKAPRQAKSKPASKEAEREGSAFNNSVFLSSVATDADKAEPPLLE